jgi:hypothetical protein
VRSNTQRHFGRLSACTKAITAQLTATTTVPLHARTHARTHAPRLGRSPRPSLSCGKICCGQAHLVRQSRRPTRQGQADIAISCHRCLLATGRYARGTEVCAYLHRVVPADGTPVLILLFVVTFPVVWHSRCQRSEDLLRISGPLPHRRATDTFISVLGIEGSPALHPAADPNPVVR